jgi:HK97 family phage prohead protease
VEFKSFDLVEFKTEPEGTFTARFSTFDKPDKGGDIMRRGAAAVSIANMHAIGKRLPVIFNHLHHNPEAWIGKVNPHDLHEGSIGLEASGRLDIAEPYASKIFRLIQDRILTEWSFAYLVQKAKRLADGTRELLQIELLEIGPTLVGMGDTATLAVKAEDLKTNGTPGPLAPYFAQLDLVRRQIRLERALRT